LFSFKHKLGFVAVATLASIAVSSITGLASPAQAEPQRATPAMASAAAVAPAALDGTWSCNIPSGYVWDRTQRVLNTCGSGWAFRYRLQTPRNNLVACTTVPSMTYDQVYNSLNVCNPSGFQYSDRLRTPVNGMWACAVPNGWSWSSTQNTFNVCNPGGWGWSYRLRS
jgi:hypothetical protein